jgi:hypothetical protein
MAKFAGGIAENLAAQRIGAISVFVAAANSAA